MARNTVLVLGAGASFGARPHDSLKPPCGKGLADELLRWFRFHDDLRDDPLWSAAMDDELNFEAPPESIFDFDPDVRPILLRAAELSKASATAFEEVMADLLGKKHRRVLDRVNEVLCFAMLCGKVCAFEQKPDLYDVLFTHLRSSLRGIITPNYDLLTEEALERVGLTYRYRAIDNASDEPADVVLDKFHGSVNWFQLSGVGGGATLEAAQANTKPLKAMRQRYVVSHYNDHPVFTPPGNPRKNAVGELKHGNAWPVLVTYGPGKDSLYGRPQLDRVRQTCAAELHKNPPARIVALGISPPRGGGDDDAWESLCNVFASLGCAKEYWSKVSDEREGMAKYGFEGHDGYLDELIIALTGA